MVQYLQMQDRIGEAIKLFKTIPAESLPSDGTLRIQYDYMSAYFDFFTGQGDGFKVARAVVRKYEDYPILAWKIPFLEILDQLNEYDGEILEEPEESKEPNGDIKLMTEETRRLKVKNSQKKEPVLSFEVAEGGTVGELNLEVANVKKVAFKFYIIDVEVLFSRTPFLKSNNSEFSYVKPCHVIERSFEVNPEGDANPSSVKIAVPDHLKLMNMVIELNGDGKQHFQSYCASQLKVSILEAFGEVKVHDMETDKPLCSVYVKVFARDTSGKESFYKDGYTDMGGRFDYV